MYEKEIRLTTVPVSVNRYREHFISSVLNSATRQRIRHKTLAFGALWLLLLLLSERTYFQCTVINTVDVNEKNRRRKVINRPRSLGTRPAKRDAFWLSPGRTWTRRHYEKVCLCVCVCRKDEFLTAQNISTDHVVAHAILPLPPLTIHGSSHCFLLDRCSFGFGAKKTMRPDEFASSLYLILFSVSVHDTTIIARTRLFCLKHFSKRRMYVPYIHVHALTCISDIFINFVLTDWIID